jgi:hypothetical protein
LIALSAATIRRVIIDLDADHLDDLIYQWLRTRSGWDTRDEQPTSSASHDYINNDSAMALA